MFRTNFRYENGKEDTFYMSTTADALLGEYDVYFLHDIFESLYYDELCDLI